MSGTRVLNNDSSPWLYHLGFKYCVIQSEARTDEATKDKDVEKLNHQSWFFTADSLRTREETLILSSLPTPTQQAVCYTMVLVQFRAVSTKPREPSPATDRTRGANTASDIVTANIHENHDAEVPEGRGLALHGGINGHQLLAG